MKIFRTAILIIIALLLAIAALFFLYNRPASGEVSEEPVVVEIQRGETLTSISENLEDQNLIRSGLLLRIISKVKKTESKMKSGQYSINRSMSTFQIYNMIVSGAALLHKVTIPEGLTVTKIAAIIEQNNIAEASGFIEAVNSSEIIKQFNIEAETLEGYLFPDSYFFPQNYPAEKVVTFMVESFFQKLETIYPEYKDMSPQELEEKVKVASIVEREYRAKSEAPLIASVFFNRLNIRMPLGSCATVEYIITEILQKPHPEFLTYKDIAIESDYNTYIRYGLPPTPICSPGAVALDAAFNPAETDYLYFLLRDKNSGEHYFSRKLSEHNSARVLYLKK